MLLSKRPEMFLPEKWPSYFSKAKGAKVDTADPVVNFKLDGVSLSFKTAIEMKETAIFFGRPRIIANLKMLRSFLVVVYYKFSK